jgi:hypothetical protein
MFLIAAATASSLAFRTTPAASAAGYWESLTQSQQQGLVDAFLDEGGFVTNGNFPYQDTASEGVSYALEQQLNQAATNYPGNAALGESEIEALVQSGITLEPPVDPTTIPLSTIVQNALPSTLDIRGLSSASGSVAAKGAVGLGTTNRKLWAIAAGPSFTPPSGAAYIGLCSNELPIPFYSGAWGQDGRATWQWQQTACPSGSPYYFAAAASKPWIEDNGYYPCVGLTASQNFGTGWGDPGNLGNVPTLGFAFAPANWMNSGSQDCGATDYQWAIHLPLGPDGHVVHIYSAIVGVKGGSNPGYYAAGLPGTAYTGYLGAPAHCTYWPMPGLPAPFTQLASPPEHCGDDSATGQPVYQSSTAYVEPSTDFAFTGPLTPTQPSNMALNYIPPAGSAPTVPIVAQGLQQVLDDPAGQPLQTLVNNAIANPWPQVPECYLEQWSQCQAQLEALGLQAVQKSASDPVCGCAYGGDPTNAVEGMSTSDTTFQGADLTYVGPGSTIYVYVNPPATAPNCSGMTVSACRVAFTQAGFTASPTINWQSGAPTNTPVGNVISTDPAAGTQTTSAPETPVTINGAGLQVPDCYGSASASACGSLLDRAGLTTHHVTTLSVDDAVLDVPAGAVTWTTPTSNAWADPASDVEITVNPSVMPDPTKVGEAGFPDCDLSATQYPADNGLLPAFTPVVDPSLVSSPTFSGIFGATVLHYGTASYIGLDERGNPDYDGWGYRHIKAGHGWTLADDGATRTALKTFGEQSYNANALNAYVYYGPKYSGSGGITCRREVLVEYGTVVGEPGPKGIITSYGRDVNDLPQRLR